MSFSRASAGKLSCRLQHAHIDTQADGGHHVDEGIDAEQVDLAAQQIGHARLRHAKPLGRFGLRPEEKFRDIIGLYLNPPHKALVLCCDEKSQC